MQEANWLLTEGLQADGKCAARAIGYRQAMHFLQGCRDDPSHITAGNLVGPSHLLLHHLQPGMPSAMPYVDVSSIAFTIPAESSGAQALLSWQGMKSWKRMKSLSLCSAQHKICTLWLSRHQLTAQPACRFRWCGTSRQLLGNCATDN